MDRRKFSFSIVALASLAACGGGDGDGEAGDAPAGGGDPTPPAPPAGPELASATSLPAGTTFAQSVMATDSDSSAAPGQANDFDLDVDFSLADGFDDQLDGALVLTIELAGNTFAFPRDQAYSELTALGPELGTADGVKSVSFSTEQDWLVSGTCSAVLHAVPDARLQQRLDLTGAAGHALDLTWSGLVSIGPNCFRDEPFFMQVVVRDTAGNLLATLFHTDVNGDSGSWGSASLTPFAGQVVVLSFEQRAPVGTTSIDSVSVIDTVTSTEYVTNGDFEAGGTGWTVPELRVAQNVRSGERNIAGPLNVQRTFYTQPDALWGRMTDVFTNTGASAVQANVVYTTDLGSDGGGIVYPTPGAEGKALTTWDGDTGDRDVGFVFGSASDLGYASATALQSSDGSEFIKVSFSIDVPAGGSVTLVNFVILSGTDTSRNANDATARATEVDAAAADIANNFRTRLAYQRGLTQAQLDTLKNF